jgi:hypothetical protein
MSSSPLTVAPITEFVNFGYQDREGRHEFGRRMQASSSRVWARVLGGHGYGIDHKRLTCKYLGRHFRLTDVHGELVDKMLA